MKFLSIPVLILGLLGLFVLPAFAGFIDYYDVSNWTQTESEGLIFLPTPNLPTSTGSTADLPLAPVSISMTSSDIEMAITDTPVNKDFTIAASEDGLVGFEWDYHTNDLFGPYWDPFGYLLNGVFTKLTVDSGEFSLTDPVVQSNSVLFAVMMGDVFGFRAHSTDSRFGPATTVISNFNFFNSMIPVPEPSTLVLLGSGLAGLVAWRKKKTPG